MAARPKAPRKEIEVTIRLTPTELLEAYAELAKLFSNYRHTYLPSKRLAEKAMKALVDTVGAEWATPPETCEEGDES